MHETQRTSSRVSHTSQSNKNTTSKRTTSHESSRRTTRINASAPSVARATRPSRESRSVSAAGDGVSESRSSRTLHRSSRNTASTKNAPRPRTQALRTDTRKRSFQEEYAPVPEPRSRTRKQSDKPAYSHHLNRMKRPQRDALQ